MKRNLIFTRQWLVTALLLVIGLSSYGCSDTASVSEDVAAPLASLTVTPGGLQPAFFANTTNYAVNAPTSAPSVTVTAVPKDSTAIVTIDGLVTSQRSVPLGGPGSTKTILIAVETLNGLETTYTVTVTRLLSSDNNLKSLTVTEGTLNPSPFNAVTLDYTVDVANTVGQVTVTATKSDPNATMVISSAANSVTVGPGPNPTGQLPVTLSGPGTATPVSIEVTAPNGDKKTYQIAINRLSGDNTLSEVKVSAGSVEQFVDLNNPPYTVNVATDVTSVTVTATKSDPNAAMTGHVTAGAGIPTGTTTRDLGPPGPEIDIELLITVAAPDPNVDLREYRITVKRAALSSNANLSALLVTADPLNLPTNHPVDLSNPPYLVHVATDVRTVTVTATLEDTNATMTIDGVNALSGVSSHVIFLRDPELDTDIPIVVTAVNGTPQTYTITVHRADPGPPPPP